MDPGRAWLEVAFSSIGEPVPEYEDTPEARVVIEKLASASETQTALTEIVIQDINERASEYRSEAARIREILSVVGLQKENLSDTGRNCVQVLGILASELGLRSTDTSSYINVLANLILRDCALQRQQETCSSQQSQMQQDLGRATSTLGCYQSVLARLQAEAPAHENLMHDRQAKISLLTEKAKQYSIQLSNSKERLARAGDLPTLRHGAMKQMKVEYDKLVEDSTPVLAKLRTYQCLPPDRNQALIELERKKQQLADIQMQLDNACAAALE